MGTPVYYVVLGALLAVLIITLVYLIRKRKREEEQIRAYQEKMDKLRAERKAEAEKKQPNWRFWNEENQYTTYNEAERPKTKWRQGKTYIDEEPYIPKYAAGDDMDRINRNSEPEKTPAFTIVLAAMALITIAAVVITSHTGIRIPNTTKSITTEKLNVELVSADTNPDRTKVYVTVHYKNESANTCYNIVTTISLTYDEIVADTVKHKAAAMPGGTELEEVVTLTIPEEYRNAAYYVKANTQYKWKAT